MAVRKMNAKLTPLIIDVLADRLSSRTPPPFMQNNIAFAKCVVDSTIKRFIHKGHSKVGGIGSANEWRLVA